MMILPKIAVPLNKRGLNDKKRGFFTADCVKFMRGMSDDVVDLTVTSPPYDNLRDYKGYEFNFHLIADELLRITKPGGVVVWVIGDRINGGRTLTSFEQGIYFRNIGFSVHDVMIYQKRNTPFMRRKAYTNCYEFMFVLSKGSPSVFNPIREKTARHGEEMLVCNKKADGINRKIKGTLKKMKTKTNIWAYAVGMGGTTNDKVAFNHPAIFPEKLAEDHILSWTDKGMLVFDPMCGSGTTGKMAHKHGREFLCVDVCADYIKIAKSRLRNLQNAL